MILVSIKYISRVDSWLTDLEPAQKVLQELTLQYKPKIC